MTELRLRTVPYNFYGTALWSVEDMNGFTYRYCDTKQQALDHIKDVDENLDYYTRAMREA